MNTTLFLPFFFLWGYLGFVPFLIYGVKVTFAQRYFLAFWCGPVAWAFLLFGLVIFLFKRIWSFLGKIK